MRWAHRNGATRLAAGKEADIRRKYGVAITEENTKTVNAVPCDNLRMDYWGTGKHARPVSRTIFAVQCCGIRNPGVSTLQFRQEILTM